VVRPVAPKGVTAVAKPDARKALPPAAYGVELLPRRALPRVGHERYRGSTGFLDLVLTAKTPLLIGSGDVEIGSGSQTGIYQTFTRSREEVVIPGSSLKGVLRSYAEALSPSCLGGQCHGDTLCPACSIFGAPSYAGRVAVFDLSANPCRTYPLSIKARWKPGKGRPYERKFYHHLAQVRPGDERVEVVAAGTRFRGHGGGSVPAGSTPALAFRNLEDWELGLVFLALGLAPDYRFLLKVGGGKAQGLGSARVEVTRVTVRRAEPGDADDRREDRLEEYGATLVSSYLQFSRDHWDATFRGVTVYDLIKRIASKFMKDSAAVATGGIRQ
jgi:CRISPR/Cas system CSM-associated protein Csm3 (group 7 of RAMP superfamily)